MSAKEDLYDIAQRLMASGMGILAADESVTTMNARLAAVDVEESAEMRRVYRQLLFTAPDIEKYMSGVILFDASVRNSTDEGIPFPDLLMARGIIPGVKVDKGLVDVPEFPGEKVAQGLDDLKERLTEYASLGMQFAKWRAAFPISDTLPTDESSAMNAVMMARYASLCHEVGIVPIVEPEVLMHGKHTLERSEQVTARMIQILFATLKEYKIDHKAVILKTSMAIAGDEYAPQSTAEEVANVTVRMLKATVPEGTAGVVFLSGGQTPVRATENLNAIAKLGAQPWPITFSYSRAIEEPVLAAWKGKEENEETAQAALLHRLAMNAKAQKGEYNPAEEKK